MGWFKVWDNEWLNDIVLSSLSDKSQAGFLRCICVANQSIDQGRFTINKSIPIIPEQIQRAAKISESTWDELVDAGLLFHPDGQKEFWAVRGFKKWQNEYQRQKGYRQTHRSDLFNTLAKRDGDGCALCGSRDNLELTLKDKTKDPSQQNSIILCLSCNRKRGLQGYTAQSRCKVLGYKVEGRRKDIKSFKPLAHNLLESKASLLAEKLRVKG